MNENIKILLIDDEIDFLDVTAKRLKRRGYKVRMALNCGEGLAQIEAAVPDVVVLDVMLPDIDGIQCLKEMRQRYPDLAVILLTGHASMEAGLRSMRYGASDYCLKPVQLEELVDRIEIVVRDSRA